MPIHDKYSYSYLTLFQHYYTHIWLEDMVKSQTVLENWEQS